MKDDAILNKNGSLSDKIFDKELCLGDDISKVWAKDVKDSVKMLKKILCTDDYGKTSITRLYSRDQKRVEKVIDKIFGSALI